MNRTAAVVAAALAASCAHANPAGTWSWDWVHVEPGTTNQITPRVPGVVSPGEAVEFRGTFEFSGMGTTVTNHHGFEGPIVGIGVAHLFFHANANNGGSFYGPVHRDPAAPGADPIIGPDAVRAIAIGQFATPGEPLAVTGTTFPNAVRIRWDPVHYDNRTVAFHGDRGPLPPIPGTTGTTVYILRDSATLDYASYYLPMASWGGTIEVPIIPSPSGLALLGLAGMLAIRRQERRVNSLRTCSCRWGRGTLAE